MLNMALFGCGRIGRVHASSIADHDDAKLVWVCDPVADAAQALADRYGARATAAVDEVLDDSTVDGVIIAAPTPVHLDLLSRAVDAGKTVLCEKPIDLDLQRIDETWAALEPKNPRVMLGFNRRFDPSFRQIHERVRKGEIGPLRELRIVSRDPEPPPRDYVAASGGIFRDMTIHDFDMARYFLGDVVEVQAALAAHPGGYLAGEGDADQAMVLLRGADGALCHITNSRSCVFGYDQRLEAFGDNGMLEALNQQPDSVRSSAARSTGAGPSYLRFFVERYREAYRAEFAEFARTITDGTAPSPDYADGRAALELAEAAIRSAATGTAVKLTGTADAKTSKGALA
jgi:myo-inositol 2-dehydrogenase/D-chiro-inositol 1-dehydrogenase